MVNRFWEKQPEEFASFGTVLRSEKNGLGISSQVDVQAAQAVHPYGIYSLPCEQDEVLMLPTQASRRAGKRRNFDPSKKRGIFKAAF